VAGLNPAALQQALGLYLVTDQSLTRGRPLADVVAAAVQGGVTCVQLREKQLNSRDFLAQAVLLKKLLAPYGVPLVINDRIDIALACGAEGVHLGQSDMPVEVARRLLPSDVFIGWSVETMADVAQSARWTIWA
jgi:thiamine-phosphate pyrophosphorylase